MSPKPWSSEACLSLKDEDMDYIFNAKETDIGADLFRDKYSQFTWRAWERKFKDEKHRFDVHTEKH